jgi:hypothetical protein
MEYGVLGTDVKLQTTCKKSQLHDFKMFTSLYLSLGRGEEKRGGFSFGPIVCLPVWPNVMSLVVIILNIIKFAFAFAYRK